MREKFNWNIYNINLKNDILYFYKNNKLIKTINPLKNKLKFNTLKHMHDFIIQDVWYVNILIQVNVWDSRDNNTYYLKSPIYNEELILSKTPKIYKITSIESIEWILNLPAYPVISDTKR